MRKEVINTIAPKELQNIAANCIIYIQLKY